MAETKKTKTTSAAKKPAAKKTQNATKKPVTKKVISAKNTTSKVAKTTAKPKATKKTTTKVATKTTNKKSVTTKTAPKAKTVVAQNAAKVVTEVKANQNENKAVPKTHLVDRNIYSLSAIFLGAFGVHKFIAKKNNQGYLYLAITLIAFILTISGLKIFKIVDIAMIVIGVIEGIIGFTKKPDKNGNIEI